LLPSGQVLVASGYYVNLNIWPSSAELYDSAVGRVMLLNPVKRPGGAFTFAFTGAPNGAYSVLMAADPSLPLTGWTLLGVIPEFSSGLFTFSDAQAATGLQRFYRVVK
jgi:hypothetical protein